MNESALKVYTSDSALCNPRILVREMFDDLVASRELAWRLAVRDIRARYRQAFLGILWAFFLRWPIPSLGCSSAGPASSR